MTEKLKKNGTKKVVRTISITAAIGDAFCLSLSGPAFSYACAVGLSCRPVGPHVAHADVPVSV